MAGGINNISSNLQTVDFVSSSTNVGAKDELVGQSFKDTIKNKVEKNNSKSNKSIEKTNSDKEEDTKEDVTQEVKQENCINELLTIAQNQIVYADFIIEKNVETPINEQAVSSETNIFPLEQEGNILNTNTNLSNVKVLDTDKSISVDKNISNQGNIILNIKNSDLTETTKEFKIEDVSILENNNTNSTSNTSNTNQKISNNNISNNISENRNILNYNDTKIEKDIVLEKSPDDDLMQKSNESLFSGFESALQTVQKTSKGDVIQVKVSDSNLINSDTVINQLSDKIIMRNNNEFDLQLEPEELGKIHVNVIFENGETKVSISCATQQAMDTLSGNVDKLAAVLENRTGNTTFVQIKNEENQQYNQNYQQQEGRHQERGSDEGRRDKRSKTENSIDFLEQMRLGLI